MSRESFPLPPGAHEDTTTVNGVRLHYVVAGERGPLALLAGIVQRYFGGSASETRSQWHEPYRSFWPDPSAPASRPSCY